MLSTVMLGPRRPRKYESLLAVFAVVRENIVRVMPDLDLAQISLDVTLAELGCNSIDRANVVVVTMECLRIKVPVSEFRDVENIRSLVRLLQRHA